MICWHRTKLVQQAKSKDVAVFRILTSWCSVARLPLQSDARNSIAAPVTDERHCSRNMKSFDWSQLHSVKAPGSNLEGNNVKRDSSDVMALVISRQGAARGKMQPLFAYHLNPAANDPRGEVVKTKMSYFFR